MPLDLVVQVFVELPQLPHPVAHTVLEVLVALGLFMPVAINFQKTFVIGLYHVYLQIVAFGTLGVVGPPAAFVGARNSQPDHVPA